MEWVFQLPGMHLANIVYVWIKLLLNNYSFINCMWKSTKQFYACTLKKWDHLSDDAHNGKWQMSPVKGALQTINIYVSMFFIETPFLYSGFSWQHWPFSGRVDDKHCLARSICVFWYYHIFLSLPPLNNTCTLFLEGQNEGEKRFCQSYHCIEQDRT